MNRERDALYRYIVESATDYAIFSADPDRRIILVALTGFGQAHDRARALTAGFDAHLTKPADVAALHGALAHVCPRRVR